MLSLKRLLVAALIPFCILPSITVTVTAANVLTEVANQEDNGKDTAGEVTHVDAGNNGGIDVDTPHQHATHFNAHKHEVAESHEEAIFHQMDRDHDAMLSMEEFVNNFSIIGTKGKGKDYTNINSNSKSGFWKAFSTSTTMIIATEIGDKTFFIAAVLSMRHSRLVVFSGAVLALVCMTVLR